MHINKNTHLVHTCMQDGTMHVAIHLYAQVYVVFGCQWYYYNYLHFHQRTKEDTIKFSGL